MKGRKHRLGRFWAMTIVGAVLFGTTGDETASPKGVAFSIFWEESLTSHDL